MAVLIRLCADIGINPESVLALEDVDYDRDREMNYWKQRCFTAERKIKEMERREKDAVNLLSTHFGAHRGKEGD